ncbi:MAG TPA: alpha/beta fold hydrolase [Candidatus Cybelea sp.]|nr:alpha/beta fold hydrolase [Candidatus Cybelea sp.]
MRLALALLTAALFGAPLLAAAAATSASTVLPNGTYLYAIDVGGQAVGKSTIVVSREPGSIEIGESASVIGQSLVTRRTLTASTWATVSYSGSSGAKSFSVNIRENQAVLTAGAVTKQISGDSGTPLVVSENLVAAFAQLPAMLHVTGATHVTLACICGGGFTAVPGRASATSAARPAGVPTGDAALDLDFAATKAIVWYDPHSFVMHRFEVPAQRFVVALQSYDPAIAPLALPVQPTPLPTPPAKYSSSEVTIVADDGIKLRGTLTLPDGAARPVPAFLFVHGSGCLDRDETIGPNKVFGQLANRLSNDGYAVLRYDKRACGRSGGTYAVRDRLLADARDALTFLRAQPGIDPARIYVLGHSEGGELAPSIAIADKRLRGIVLMAPPAIPLEKILMQQALHDAPDADRAAIATQEQAALAGIASGKAADVSSRWLRSTFGIDPAVLIAQVPCPILILQGTKDFQVLPADTPRLVAAARAANRNVTVVMLPNDDHLFITIPADRESSLSEYFVPAYLDPALFGAIESWLNN